MNNNYKELNITKSLYRGSNDSFAERLERLDPTENYRGTELGSLDAFQRQLKRFDIQVGGSRSSTLEKFFQNGQSAVLFPEYLMRAVRQGMEENDPLSSVVAALTFISATDYRGLTTDDDLEADVTAEAASLSAFSDPVTGLHFQNTGKLGTPLGAEMIVSDAVADGTIIALDRRYALEMVVGDPVTVDADRLIDCQLERAAVTSTAGFSMVFPDAVKIMTLKTA